MTRWQIVVKTSMATKQTKDQNDNKKQTNKQNKTKTKQQNVRKGRVLKKQITNRMV